MLEFTEIYEYFPSRERRKKANIGSGPIRGQDLKPQVESLLFAAVLLLLQPIQIEEVGWVLQSVGLSDR